MSRLSEIGEKDQWRCWICDDRVDQDMSVNDSRGPSIDSITTKSKAKGKTFGAGTERLAHRGCNTGKGAAAPVVPWADHLCVVDAAPITATVERRQRKGGRGDWRGGGRGRRPGQDTNVLGIAALDGVGGCLRRDERAGRQHQRDAHQAVAPRVAPMATSVGEAGAHASLPSGIGSPSSAATPGRLTRERLAA